MMSKEVKVPGNAPPPDITQRKRMEEQAEEIKELYGEMIELSPDGIIALDTKGIITLCNAEATRLSGYSKDELVGKHFSKLGAVRLKDIPKYLKMFGSVLLGRGIESMEVPFYRKDGVARLVSVRISRLQVSGKTIIQATARDITKRKQMERELQEKNEQLDVQNEELQSQAEELITQQQELIEKTGDVEKANRLKSEFLSNMSHQLRTPLNVIIGFSELMRDEVPGRINDEQRQCFGDILASGEQLLDLINDVLDLSKIESGKMEPELTNLALTEVIESLARTMLPILAPRRQSLDVEIEGGLPLVYADKVKVSEVLLNLLSNATKFNPDGGRLKIEAMRKGDWCRVSVIDNGIGIRKEYQKEIFEPFCQLDNPLTKEKSGTGLGLTLVKQIIEKHGGQIRVESEYGQGSRFTFTLPLATTS